MTMIYATLSREQLDGEIKDICKANVRLLLRCLREGRTTHASELAEPAGSATRRAPQRVPLDQVLTACMTGARVVWDVLAREARPEEHDELLSDVQLVLAYLREVTAVVSKAYVDEQAVLVGDERDARRELTEALLSTGSARAALAERAGIRVRDSDRAAALRLGASVDDADPVVSAMVVGRRKIRRAVEAIETLVGGPALTLVGSRRWGGRPGRGSDVGPRVAEPGAGNRRVAGAHVERRPGGSQTAGRGVGTVG
ncbi:MAG: hypothetical protein ACR2HR_14575 [Euzebya sp.]